MSSILKIFDHDCHPLVELNAPTTPRQWILNGVGRADFSDSTSDANCIEQNFQWGNLVYVEHLPSQEADNTYKGKLPFWVGVILPPRTWDLGVVHVTAYTAESILSYRPMPQEHIEGTAHDVFTRIITLANQFATTWGSNATFKLGVVENVPGTFSDDLCLSAFEHIGKLTSQSGMDWDVTAEIAPNGNLQLYANLYARKSVYAGVPLNNLNVELSGALLTEQGAPSNIVMGISQAATKQERYAATGVNQESLAACGPLGVNQTFFGAKSVSAVHTAAQARADKRGWPVKTISRTALDIGQTFSYVAVGNEFDVVENNAGFAPGGGFGFTARARITSVSFNELSLRCPLTLEIV